MRRYDIVSGILLILSTIDFALAAPVLVKEKRQACVDVVHIPKDVTTVLGKRWEEDLEKLWESSATHTSSSSVPSELDHGSMNVVTVQAPAPNPTLPTANRYLLTDSEVPSPSSTPSWLDDYDAMWDDVRSDKSNDELHGPLHIPRPSGKGDDELHASGPLYTTTSSAYASSGYGSDQEFTNAHAPQPNPNPRPSIEPDSSAVSDFNWNYWMNSEGPPPRPAPPNEFGQAHAYQVDQMNLPSTSGYAPSQTGPKHEVVTSPSPNLGSLKEPEEMVPGQAPTSSTVDSQPVDPQAAVYAAKGKAKESRRVSGTARDVRNAELQPTTEWPLDSGEILTVKNLNNP